MSITSISIDPERLALARQLTNARSNKDVVDLALRRLIAHESKSAMVASISALSDLPEGLGAPTVDYPEPTPEAVEKPTP